MIDTSLGLSLIDLTGLIQLESTSWLRSVRGPVLHCSSPVAPRLWKFREDTSLRFLLFRSVLPGPLALLGSCWHGCNLSRI